MSAGLGWSGVGLLVLAMIGQALRYNGHDALGIFVIATFVAASTLLVVLLVRLR